MSTTCRPLSFGSHVVAVLSAVAAVAMALAAYAVGENVLLTPGRLGAGDILMMSSFLGFGLFLVAFPVAMIVLTPLWPVTRRLTGIPVAICLLAAIAAAATVAPFGAHQAVSPRRFLTFVGFGFAVGAVYVLVAMRLRAAIAPQPLAADAG